jgi:hypothetical protein
MSERQSRHIPPQSPNLGVDDVIALQANRIQCTGFDYDPAFNQCLAEK